jgi:ferrochelatase
MRYWRPMSDEVAAAVKTFAPDEVVLLPLYPQFSSTTTASSYRAWLAAAAALGLTSPAKLICSIAAELGRGGGARCDGIAQSRAKPSGCRRSCSRPTACREIVGRGDPRHVVHVGPTIAAALGWQRREWRGICNRPGRAAGWLSGPCR